MRTLRRLVVGAAVVAGAFVGFAYNSGSYVQDGLIAQWDGIDNAGVGKHDASATVWKDLVGGRVFTLTGVTVNEDRMTFAGTASSYGTLSEADTTAIIKVAGDKGTIEIVLHDTSAAGSKVIVLQSSSATGVAISKYGTTSLMGIPTQRLYGWTWDSQSTNTVSVTYESGTATSLVADGAEQERLTTKNYWTTTKNTTTIGTRASKGNYHLKGSIYAIRIYDRHLTAGEAAKNRVIDTIRFKTGMPDDALDVIAQPAEFPFASTPAAGRLSDLAENDTVACSSPAGLVEVADGIRAFCAGWKLYDASGSVASSGATSSFDYVHPGSYRRLEWQWIVSNRVSVVSCDPSKGTVSTAGGYFLNSESVSVAATPASGYVFACWAGDVPDDQRTNLRITLPADCPRRAIACFLKAGEPVADNVLCLAPWGSDANDGSDWTHAFQTPNAAATAANQLTGTTVVLVAPGTYPSLVEAAKITASVTFLGLTAKPEDAILRLADGQTRLFWLDNAAAKLQALTLEGGSGKGTAKDTSTALDGRGRNTYVTAGTLDNCIIRGGKLASVTASGYRSVQVYLTGASSLMTHCVVSNNVMTGWGSSGTGSYSTPGVLLGSGARIEYSLVADNRDTSNRDKLLEAGGVTIVNGTMDHCTVVGNWSPYVGGVFIENVKNGSVSNSIIWGNRSTYNGAASDDILASTAKQFTDCLVSPEDPYALFANVVGGDWRSVVGSDAEGFGYADDPQAASFVADNPSFVGSRTVAFSVQPVEGATAYKWDFDGDGTDDATTTAPSATYAYTTPNRYDVRLSVETAGGSVVCRKPNFVFAAPSTMYVKQGNAGAAYPYDTPERAAADIQTAIDAQRTGGTVQLAADRYEIEDYIVVQKDIRLAGETGNPEDVVLAIAPTAERSILLNAEDALITGLVSEGGTGTGWGRNAYVDKRGGTFSNCVFRNCSLSGTFNANAFVHAIFMRGPDALITHSVITNNNSTCSGTSINSRAHVHGVYLSVGARLENSLVADNLDTGSRTSVHDYGTVYGNGSVRNSTIVNNRCNETAGLRLTAGSVRDTVVAGNVSNGLPGEDNVYSGSANLADHCVTSDGTPLNASCAVGAVTAIFKDWDGKDYRPVADTVLVDTGAGLAAELPSVDLVGNPRFAGAAVDIGCYELDASQFGVTLGSDETKYTVPREIFFTATVTGAGDSDDLRYYWDFNGDGVTDAETTTNVASHVYSASGSASVSVCVTNFTGTVRGTSDYRAGFLQLMPHTIYFDPAVGTASAWPYLSWETAATNLQEAVDASIAGVTIVARAGTYVGDTTIRIEKAIRLTGESADPDVTVFRCDGKVRQFYLGGGAELVNCSLEGAVEPLEGGALYVAGSGATVSNVILRGVAYTKGMNSNHRCYPIRLLGASTLATHMIVTGNTSTVSGSADASDVMNNLGFLLQDGARVENTLFAYNVDTGVRSKGNSVNGGVVQGNGRLVNCTVVSNVSYSGAAVSLSKGSVVNTVSAGNQSTVDAASPNIKEALANVLDHCQIGGELAALFRSPARGDWTPSCSGPLYGCGTLDGIETPAKDLRGNPRIHKKIDIGCYECQSEQGLMIIVR